MSSEEELGSEVVEKFRFYFRELRELGSDLQTGKEPNGKVRSASRIRYPHYKERYRDFVCRVYHEEKNDIDEIADRLMLDKRTVKKHIAKGGKWYKANFKDILGLGLVPPKSDGM